jgi:phosphatidylinositol alpha-mannosyltransferase
VIPYGVELGPRPDTRPQRTPGSLLRFGIVGSILPHKGVHVAVAAFAGIDPAQARLTVWGDPGIDPAYTGELEALRGAGAVEIHGRFPEERKGEIFAGIDALLVPSIGLESFGLVAREALHHGVPVLASDRGALQELFVDGEAGALFPPEDPQALRGWIERLIADPGQLDRWSRMIRPVKGFDVHAEEIEEIYERVLTRRSADRLDKTLVSRGGRRRRTA